MAVFKKTVVLSTFTQTEDEKFTKWKEKAGSHTAQSAIRRCFAQQCSWVIGWLHGVLMAQWPPVQESSAFLEMQGEEKKNISAFQRTNIKCKISQHICWKHWHNYPFMIRISVPNTPSFSGETRRKHVFQMKSMFPFWLRRTKYICRWAV